MLKKPSIPAPTTEARMAPSDFAFDLTEEVASYMRAKFLQGLKSQDNHVPFPTDWDVTLLQECDQAVGILLQAYHNACEGLLFGPFLNNSVLTWVNFLDQTKWSADDYVKNLTARASGQNQEVEAKLLKKYPPIFTPTKYEMDPCVVKDDNGIIMLWYTPGLLMKHRSVS